MDKIIGYKINGVIEDLHKIDVKNIENTIKKEPVYIFSEEGEDILRHSAAHILGEVILKKYKNVSFAIGPTTDYGFYYDILMDTTISLNDLKDLEEEMKVLIKKKNNFTKKNITSTEAEKLFKDDKCKNLILENILNNNDEISIYQQGDFIDLCRGPHVKNTEDIGLNFNLTKVSQVQWRGLLLQRVEGVLFYSKERLVKHLELLEKQKSIDHRKIGMEMELFQQLNVSQGNVFWLPKGEKIFHTITEYLYKKYKKYEYNMVKTPILFGNQLWKDTGHWDKYMDNMYITKDDSVVKPMNCPGHVEIFKLGNFSYKDLPYRIGEICHVHRKEETGGLNGLKRGMGFHQDDGHIFCIIEQIEKEISLFYKMLEEIYNDFGFTKYSMVLSTRPATYIGSIEIWNQAEKILLDWLQNNNINYVISEGDGAFYGPKLEIQLEDNFLRKWTCGTFQVDFFLPERLKAEYVTRDNFKNFPVMCHRAVLGSLERFLGILIENYEGHLPLWLMPTTIVIISISEKTSHYGKEIYDKFIELNLPVELDISNNTMNSKLKTYLVLKIPFIIIVGEKEMNSNTITVRYQNTNETMSLEIFLKEIYMKKIKI